GLFGFRQYGNGCSRSVNASLALGDGYALDTVYAGLKFELLVGVRSVNTKNNFLEPTDFIGRFANELNFITVQLGPADVHAVKLAGKQTGFIAAGCGTDFHDDIAVVVGVLGRQCVEKFRLIS